MSINLRLLKLKIGFFKFQWNKSKVTRWLIDSENALDKQNKKDMNEEEELAKNL